MILTVLAAALFASGCSSSLDPDPEIGSGVSSTTVIDGVEFDTEQADQAEADPAITDFVLVKVQLPADQALTGTVIVALEDVSLADAAPIELERVEMPVNDLIVAGGEVEVFLPVPLDGSLDINASAHVDVDQDGAISAGDWISTELVLVTPATARGGVFVTVQPA
ncbi:MAG: hypothetical protein AAFN30_10275 [Actinomycetota bacterium]